VCVKLTVGLFYVLVCCDGCFCCVRFSFFSTEPGDDLEKNVSEMTYFVLSGR